MSKEPLNFLSAEDDEHIAMLTSIWIKRAFPDYNVHVDEVKSGEGLLEKLGYEGKAYHGVISDNTMLGALTGEKALAITRDFKTYGIQKVPTLIFSGDSNGLQQKVEAHEDAKYLDKPANMQAFFSLMHSHWPEYAPKSKTN